MTKYLCWIEQNEGWRGRGVSRHALDRFTAGYDIVYDSDDHVVDPDAMEEFARAADGCDYDLIYCDEDVIRKGLREEPFFKPGYSPETQRSTGYIDGMVALRKGVEAGDLSRFARDRVCHIDKVLYHRNGDEKPGKKNAAGKRNGIKGQEKAGNRKREGSTEQEESKDRGEEFFIDKLERKISVIILSKDHPEMLARCVKSLTASLLADDTEIILIDNGSTDENRSLYEETVREYGLVYHYEPSEFNYPRLNNCGVSKASGDVYIFMNDDIEIPAEEKGVTERLALKAMEEGVGAVGLKLLYPGEERIQHCGVTLLHSGPSHKLQGYRDGSYYHGYSDHDINTIAVTGACLAVSRENYEAVGGFDESLPVAYNDVDLCIRLYDRGLYNVCMNSHHLIHSESATRPDDRDHREAYERLKAEKRYFTTRHPELAEGGDPFMSGNITRFGLDFDINLPEEWETSGMSDVTLLKDKVKDGKKIHASLDSFEYCTQDAYGNEDFYEIRGWIFKEGGRQAEPYVILQTEGARYTVTAQRMERRDVARSFPKEKHAAKSGFIARIPAKAMDELNAWGEVTAYPVLRGRHVLLKGDEKCQMTKEI